MQLPPPFNVIHAEDLITWAGQEDDPAWLKLLDRIGELVGRPGLSRYSQAMAADASLDELRQWALDNGDDPLVDTVWHRIHQREGEDQSPALGASEPRPPPRRSVGARRSSVRVSWPRPGACAAGSSTAPCYGA